MKGSDAFLEDDIESYDFGSKRYGDVWKLFEPDWEHEADGNIKSSSSSNSDEKRTKTGDKRSKKTWKNSLFFWKKWGKKSSDWHQEVATKISNLTSGTSAKDRGNNDLRYPAVVYRNGGRAGLSLRHTSLMSGDEGKERLTKRSLSARFVSSCLVPTRAEESRVPFMKLEQHAQKPGNLAPTY